MGYRQYDIFQDFYLSKSVKSAFFRESKIREAKMFGEIYLNTLGSLACTQACVTRNLIAQVLPNYCVKIIQFFETIRNYYACIIMHA